MTTEISRPGNTERTGISQLPNHWYRQNPLQAGIIAVVVFAVCAAIYIVKANQQNQSCALFEDYQTTDAERHHVLTALGVSNLSSFNIQNGKIYVPNAEKGKYLAAIKKENALPAVYQSTDEPNPNIFLPKSQQEIVVLNRKKQKIQDMILRLPFVSEVWFEMDCAKSDHAFQADEQSAVVMVRLVDQTALTKLQVETIQGIVAGAVAKMDANQVVVTDANVGISYQDLTDSRQSDLIDLVNWKMNRRQHYLDQLQELKFEFPGLQFHVEVIKHSAEQPTEFEQHEKIANGVPAKFANHSNHSKHSLIKRANQFSLNSTTTASVDDPSLFPNEAMQISDDKIARVTYIVADNDSHESNSISTNRDENFETVRIQVLVPQTLLANFQTQQAKSQSEAVHRFTKLKTQIVRRIKNIIPAESLATTAPITVNIADDPHQLVGPNFDQAIDKTSLYWPFVALIAIGMIGFVWNRNNVAQPTGKTAVENAGASNKPEEQALQNQLTTLIDDDPVAAAKVIKNWIRNSS